MPAGAKMSIASMNAEPMMPNMSVTPLATIVSTNASEGVIFWTPFTTERAFPGACLLIVSSPGAMERLGEGLRRYRIPVRNVRFNDPIGETVSDDFGTRQRPFRNQICNRSDFGIPV
ncbi:MAG: hypothetical protein M5U30_05165 [Burkholderiaceae bacterium]|nr:hypothetical protein [Burkholderiaceae bacterium]